MQFLISSPIIQDSVPQLNVINHPPDSPLLYQQSNDEQNEQHSKDLLKCENIQKGTKPKNVMIANMNKNQQNTPNITSSTLLPMYQIKQYSHKSIHYESLHKTITKVYQQKKNKPISSYKASGIKRLPLRNTSKHNITNMKDNSIYTECSLINGNTFYKGPDICNTKYQKLFQQSKTLDNAKKSQETKVKNNSEQIRRVKIQKQENVINKWINIYDRVYKRLQILRNNKANLSKQKYQIEKQQLKESYLKDQMNISGEISVQNLIELLIVKRIMLENPLADSDSAQRIDWSSKLFKISKLIKWFSNIFKKPTKIKQSNKDSSYKFVFEPQNHHYSEYKMSNKTEQDIRRQNKIISTVKQKVSPTKPNVSYKNYSLNQKNFINNYKFDENKKYKYYKYFKNQVFDNLCETFLKAKRSNKFSEASLNKQKETERRYLFETNNRIKQQSQVSQQNHSIILKNCESLSQSSSSKSQIQFDKKKIEKQLDGLKKLVKKTLSTMSIHIGQDKEKIQMKLKRETLANYFNYKNFSKSVNQSLHSDLQPKHLKNEKSYNKYGLNPIRAEFQRQKQLKKNRFKNFLKKRNGKYTIVTDKINKNKLVAKIKNKKQEAYQSYIPQQAQPQLLRKTSSQQSQLEQSQQNSTVNIQLQSETVKKLEEIYEKSSKRIKNNHIQSIIDDYKLTDEQIQKLLSNAHHLATEGQNEGQINSSSMLKMRRKYKKFMLSNKTKDKIAQDDTCEQVQGIRKSRRKKINNTIIGLSNQLTVDSYEKHSGFGKQNKNQTNNQRQKKSQQKNKLKLRNKQYNSILKSYQTEEHQAQIQKTENLLNQFYVNQAMVSQKKISDVKNIESNEQKKQQKRQSLQLRQTFLQEKVKKQQLEQKLQSMKSEFQCMLKSKIQIDGPSVFCQIVRKKNNRLLSQYENQLKLRKPCYLNSGQSKIQKNIDEKFQFQQDTVQMKFLKKFINQFGLLGQKDLDHKKSSKNNLFF